METNRRNKILKDNNYLIDIYNLPIESTTQNDQLNHFLFHNHTNEHLSPLQQPMDSIVLNFEFQNEEPLKDKLKRTKF